MNTASSEQIMVTAQEDRTRFPKNDGTLEARGLMALVFGIIGIALGVLFWLSPPEREVFRTFLTGQIGWGSAFSSVLFWKLLACFLGGATLGGYFSLEIPKAHLRRMRVAALVGILFLGTVLVYIPSMSAGYIWDDDGEVYLNDTLRDPYGLWVIWTGGLTHRQYDGPEQPFLLKAIRAPLVKIEEAVWGDRRLPTLIPDYFPLKSTMLWLEYRLWGTTSYGYHTVNNLLHAVNAILLYFILRRLKLRWAWFAALLFAIHPVHVESVAWVSERKNTLSLFFLLLSFRAWLSFTETGKRRQYIYALVGFLAAMLCKTSVVMYPVALVLFEWWRNGLPGFWKSLREVLLVSPRSPTARFLVQTVPFFLISLVLGLVTIWFQNGRAIAYEVVPIGGFDSRLAGAGLATWWYFSKAFFPVGLTTIYPRFNIYPHPQAWHFLAVLGVVLAGVFLWMRQKQWGRGPFFVFAFFVVFLLPVLGFFRMSYMRITLVADHFQYLSDLAAVAGVAALAGLLAERPKWRVPVIAAASLAAFVLIAYCWDRVAIYHTPRTFWADALKHNTESWQAQNHMGAIRYQDFIKSHNPDDLAAAHAHFSKAVELNPENVEVHNNLALTLNAYGRIDEALASFRRSLAVKDDIISIRINLFQTLLAKGDKVEALKELRAIAKLDPENLDHRASIGGLLFSMGRVSEAKRELQEVLRINPHHVGALSNISAIQQHEAKRQSLFPEGGLPGGGAAPVN